MSTAVWSIIDQGDSNSLIKALEADPNLVYVRSEDGRGPLFWAYEYERYDMVKILLDKGTTQNKRRNFKIQHNIVLFFQFTIYIYIFI